MTEKEETIDTGDTVFHRPTGETWLVAYVEDGKLAWCGWPEGYADLADCELKQKASEEARSKLLLQMSAIQRTDARARYARRRLGYAS
jgi:hypothetical protein